MSQILFGVSTDLKDINRVWFADLEAAFRFAQSECSLLNRGWMRVAKHVPGRSQDETEYIFVKLSEC